MKLKRMKQPPSILFLDIREAEHFKSNHVTSPFIVNIEPILLRQDMTGSDLENSLILSTARDRFLFENRHKFDVIVFYDWDTRSLETNPSLQDLSRALYEFASYRKPLPRPPVLMIGGYLEWEKLMSTKNAKSNPEMNIEQVNESHIRTIDEFFQRYPQISPVLETPVSNNRINFNYSSTDENHGDVSPGSSGQSNLISQNMFHTPYPLSSPSTYNRTPNSAELRRKNTVIDHPFYNFNNVMGTTSLDTVNQYPTNSPSNNYASKEPPSYNIEREPHNLNIPQAPIPRKESPILEVRKSYTSSFGFMGLTNLGNSCYMNSVLQALSGTTPFARYFLKGDYKKDIVKPNFSNQDGLLSDAFNQLFQVMWQGERAYCSPVTIKRLIGQLNKQFANNDQQDSQELLSFLLDTVHEELNRARISPHYNDRILANGQYKDDKKTLTRLSEENWLEYHRKNDSIVTDLFGGQLCSRVKCVKCGYSSYNFTSFNILSVPIPSKKSKNGWTIEQCFKLYTTEETLQGDNKWNCPRCKKNREAKKQMWISRLPTIMIVQFKRFLSNGPWRDKVNSFISFPFNQLDMSKFCTPDIPSDQFGSAVYELYSVVNHHGTLNGGHYTSAVRDGHRQIWRVFDDSRVMPDNGLRHVITPNAYIVFYVKSS